MGSGLVSSNQPDNLLVGPFSEEETSSILGLLFRIIDTPFKKSEPVPKTILVDFFGTQKSMKTTVTGKIEQVFRRHKFNAFCPPETAEIEAVRNKLTDDQVVAQAIHLTGVQDYVLNLAQHPRAHVAIISRGLIDMLYWYERGLRKGVYDPSHVERINGQIYELLGMNLVDTFFYFTCSVDVAMKREYDGALTQRRGSKMNEKDVAETLDIYRHVLEGVNKNIPGLPIFHVDTSDMDVRQAGEEVMKYLLPTICARFNVPMSRVMPFVPSLIRRHASQASHFEEQIKFTGHPVPFQSEFCNDGWNFVAEYWQEDTYLNSAEQTVDPLGEIMRIRRDENGFKFMYKGAQKDSLLSHRFPCSFPIDEAEVQKIQEAYKTVVVLRKKRRCFEKKLAGHHFTLHLDDIEELGKFSELRVQGFTGITNTEALLTLAGTLGFTFASVVEGNYLSLALSRQTPQP